MPDQGSHPILGRCGPRNTTFTVGSGLLRSVLVLFFTAISSTLVSASTNLSKSVENIYMYHKDQAVLNLDEYIMGDGSAVSISSNSPNAEVDQKVVLPPLEHNAGRTGCWITRMFPVDSETIYYLCPKNILIRASLKEAAKDPITTITIAPEEYECHDIVVANDMQTLIGICMSVQNETDARGSIIRLEFVNSQTMLSVNSYSDKQVAGKNITFLNTGKPLSESLITARLEGRMLLVASIQKPREFKVYVVEYENKVSGAQTYALGANILDVPFNHTLEKCGFEELVADVDYIYLTTSCDNNFRKYFCRCTPESNSKIEGKELRCIKKECFFKEYSSNSEYTSQIKLLKRITGKNGDSVYYFNGTSLFLRDFGKLISKEMFRFNDISLVNKRSFVVKDVVLMGKLMHLAVLIPATNPANNALDMISVSISRQYYRRITLLKGDYANAAIEFVPENPARFSLYQLAVHFPVSGKSYLFEDNSILSMKFNLEAPETQKLFDNRRRLQTKAGEAGEAQSSQSDQSPLIVIPVQFSITASGKTNLVSLNLNVLVDENESAQLDLPKELVFYHGSLPLVLPLSKQSIQGYSPSLTVTGQNGRVHKVEYMSPVQVRKSSPDLFPQGKVQFYHLDNNLFLLRSKETLKVIEFRANRNSTESTFVERQTTMMSVQSEFFDAVSGDDLNVYILVNTTESSVCLVILKTDGSLVLMPYELERAQKVLMGTLNIFNGAIEIDVLIQAQNSNDVELYILNTPISDIEKKTSSFKLYPFLPRNICPKWIEWASRKLPYLYVESNCEGKYTIFEIFLEAVRESEVPINTFFLRSDSGNLNMSVCAYDKNLMLINRVQNEIKGMDRLTEFNPKIRYYPLAEYNVTGITRYHCDHANPFLGILGPDESGNFSKVVLYRVEESGDNSLRRVHSVITLKKLYSSIAVLTLHTDPDGIKGYVTILENGELEQYIFNLAVPSVIVESIGDNSEETLQFKLGVEFSNSTDGYQDEVTATVKMRLVNQSFSTSGYLVGNQPLLKEMEYSLENQFKFDGVFLRSYLEFNNNPSTAEMLKKKGIVSFTDRKTKLQIDPDKVISENSAATNIIVEKNIAFAWNNNTAYAYDRGIERFRMAPIAISSANFIQYPDPWNPKSIYIDFFAVSNAPGSLTSVMTLIWSTNQGVWTNTNLELTAKFDYAKGLRFRNEQFAYLALDSTNNRIEVARFYLNLKHSRLEPVGAPAQETIIDPLDELDAVATTWGTIIVIVKKKFSTIGTILEFGFDTQANAMRLKRSWELDLVPGVNTYFEAVTLDCAGKNHELEEVITINCFLYSEGMYSYSNKITIRGDEKSQAIAPEVKLLSRIVNMQGYTLETHHMSLDYTVLLVRKLEATRSCCQNYLVLIYKHDIHQESPYMAFTSQELGLPPGKLDESQFSVGFMSSALTEDKLFVYYRGDPTNPDTADFDPIYKRHMVYFKIGPMKLAVKTGADDNWTGDETLVIEHVTAHNPITSKIRISLNAVMGDLNSKISSQQILIVGSIMIGIPLVGLIVICYLKDATTFGPDESFVHQPDQSSVFDSFAETDMTKAGKNIVAFQQPAKDQPLLAARSDKGPSPKLSPSKQIFLQPKSSIQTRTFSD